jgi:succinate dehydrogenase / fumarate reductase, cytochrome b subunit
MAIDRPVTAPQREDAEERESDVGRSRTIPFALDFYRSAVGKKYVMAVSGIILMGYVFAHMVGNLKMYLGAEQMNHYGEFLRALLEPIFPHTGALWLLRMLLLAAVILHIHASYSLTMMNRRARPVRYQSKRDYIAADFAARTMRWTGIIVLLFVIFHLLDLTFGNANPDFQAGMPYENTVASFQRVPVALFYIVANLALGVHLYHGAWSLFQSMGWNRRRFNMWRRYFAVAFAVIVIGGNVSFPIAVLTGVIS